MLDKVVSAYNTTFESFGPAGLKPLCEDLVTHTMKNGRFTRIWKAYTLFMSNFGLLTDAIANVKNIVGRGQTLEQANQYMSPVNDWKAILEELYDMGQANDLENLTTQYHAGSLAYQLF